MDPFGGESRRFNLVIYVGYIKERIFQISCDLRSFNNVFFRSLNVAELKPNSCLGPKFSITGLTTDKLS